MYSNINIIWHLVQHDVYSLFCQEEMSLYYSWGFMQVCDLGYTLLKNEVQRSTVLFSIQFTFKLMQRTLHQPYKCCLKLIYQCHSSVSS